jgi:HPt (histidine-containing phosphotransfer) domain-containing protein
MELEQAAFTQAIDQMWARFLPQLVDRVGLLESAAEALESGRQLTAEEKEEARAAAHKLAGVLGTFGLARGTELARELEACYAAEIAAEPAGWQAEMAAELRGMVEGRQTQE